MFLCFLCADAHAYRCFQVSRRLLVTCHVALYLFSFFLHFVLLRRHSSVPALVSEVTGRQLGLLDMPPKSATTSPGFRYLPLLLYV